MIHARLVVTSQELLRQWMPPSFFKVPKCKLGVKPPGRDPIENESPILFGALFLSYTAAHAILYHRENSQLSI